MNLEERLKHQDYEQIWDYYCGFLDLDLPQYMGIQNRLMQEQIKLWSNSELGQSILKGKKPRTVEDFREVVPLTTYDDYADILLKKKADALPASPVIWIETTWEGGEKPIKVAPYTRAMLDVYSTNAAACMILATSKERGTFDIDTSYKFLYALAPLPYVTGVLPLVISEEINLGFLPPVEKAQNMSFSERNKLGFKMALKDDVEYFFGLGSVTYAISKSISSLGSSNDSGSSLKSVMSLSPKMIWRLAKAKRKCKAEKRSLKPKDLFHLKGFMVGGTDNNCYKDELEDLWGIRPMEVFAGTEPGLVGTETWTRKGLYFFPDSCFYEFIPEDEMLRSFEEPNYKPSTLLMDEVVPGTVYELVITILKGGAFARYRVGDVYRCIGLTNKEDETKLPRFEYIDRVPSVIDIGGFTRISKTTVQTAIDLSKIEVTDWVARKEFTEENKPFMHLYLELDPNAMVTSAATKEILSEILSAYFKYKDHDYIDLRKILGMDPLKISIIKTGTFNAYEKHYKRSIAKMNPNNFEIRGLLDVQRL